ncbi:MAG: gamma-D-glutamyl-meso-diaminopimelate peptidase [Clostridia bacterium]|nr:gamma-D-glutamyl-meso-diaminopimelate peptidase [Clostridia bacterium]
MHQKSYPFFEKPPDEIRQKEICVHLREAHPMLFCGEIGKSTLGRPLRFFRIGRGKQAILYVGAHHGMEWVTSLVLFRFVDDLMKAISRRGMGNLLGKDRSLFVLPMLNPDGVEIELHGASAAGLLRDRILAQNGGNEDFTHWQANARGVDLNHNYDAGFGAYKEKEKEMGIFGGAPTRYSGPAPFSESESAAMRDFLLFTHPALTLTLHTQGEEIFYHKADPPVKGAENYGWMLATLTGYRLGQAKGAAAYGGMSDYIAEKLHLPAYTLECGLGKNPLSCEAGEGIYRGLRRALFLSLITAYFGYPKKEDTVWNA